MRFCSGGADASGCAWLLLLVSPGAMLETKATLNKSPPPCFVKLAGRKFASEHLQNVIFLWENYNFAGFFAKYFGHCFVIKDMPLRFPEVRIVFPETAKSDLQF